MALIRQDRKINKRINNRKLKEGVATQYPHRRVLYHVDTLIGELFNTPEEIEAALTLGIWVKHPKMPLEDWRRFRAKQIAEVGENKEHINWAKRLKFRDSNKPIVPSASKRYIAQMNVRELITEGHKVGLFFGNPENCPTKLTMQRKIKQAKKLIEKNKK